MAEQGSYPLNGRAVQGTDTCTGVVTGTTADIPLSVISAFVAATLGTTLSGTTTQRLATVPSFVGQGFFDITLGYMLWASQISPAVWVTASGVPE